MSNNENAPAVRNDWLMIFTGGPGLSLDQSTSFEVWDELGKKLRFAEKYIQFKLGDWLNYGAAAYGEKYTQVLEASDYSRQTLANYAWVCGKITMECRNPHLPFAHHQLVAKLEPAVQVKELKHAQETDMSYEEFRIYIKAKYGKKPDAPGESNEPDPTDVLVRIQQMVRERNPSAIPTREDVAWMQSTLKSVDKLCSRVTGE